MKILLCFAASIVLAGIPVQADSDTAFVAEKICEGDGVSIKRFKDTLI